MRELARTAGEMNALQRHYQHIAPPSLVRSSHVQWLDRQLLTLAADNAAVAAKLRQLAPQLAEQLRQRGVEVTGIKVVVQVGRQQTVRSPSKRTLSSTGRQQMSELAGNLPDSPLKQALQRFARIKD